METEIKKFNNVYCSQCGGEFGPGDHGFSHCKDHQNKSLVCPSFIKQMEFELQNNKHKGDWRQWNPTALQALSELQHHEAKLINALAIGDCERVREFSADIANIAMKINEQFGGSQF